MQGGRSGTVSPVPNQIGGRPRRGGGRLGSDPKKNIVMEPLVEFQSVSFGYDVQNVVENATFSIEQGDFVCIVGPNGGGKTTLLKLMLGLLKPQSGAIRLFGSPPRQNGMKIGYTPQFLSVDFHFPLTVLDVVLLGCIRPTRSCFHNLPALWYRAKDRQAARAALRTLQLEHLADKPLRHLSGGQRQRVLIARAICSKPEILLLDEPTNNIDHHSELILSEILVELNKSMTIIMVSHDTSFVAESVRNVICVNKSVIMHPASELDDNLFHELYGRPGLKRVLHDHG